MHRTTAWGGWTIAGILAAMLIGAIHAAGSLLLEQPTRLFPRDWQH